MRLPALMLLSLTSFAGAADTRLGHAQAPPPAGQELPHAWPRDGATLLFENERVIVWDVTWLKGKPSPLHRHRYDLLGVFLAGSPIRVTQPDGTSRESVLDRGHVVFQGKGVVHVEEGLVDTNPRHAIVIDLKDHEVPALRNTSGYPAAFPREGAQKRLENDRVVVWDYTWTPGQPTPMHFHDKDVVVVTLDGGEISSTTPDGQRTTSTVTPGLARFNPRNRTHVEELVRGSVRQIIVELK
jgi:predicted metal-dependent enzyme (double-stranded beta helix superfamily)